jgi:hypothetical protein
MGDKTMFQLESAIENWRKHLSQNQTMLSEDLDELEGHLRDEMDSLMLAGLNEEEAFMVASHRLGDDAAVAQEFAKVNLSVVWKRRLIWMLFGIFISILVTALAQLSSSASAVMLIRADVSRSVSVAITSVVYFATFLMFLAILFAVFHRLDGLPQAGRRKVKPWIVLVCGVGGLLLLKAVAFILNVIGVRVASVNKISEIVIASKLAEFFWSIFWPVLIVGILIWLLSSKKRAAV